MRLDSKSCKYKANIEGNMFKNSKGQYLSLEKMILFTISVVITVSIYFSFSAAGDRIVRKTIQDQLAEVGEVTASGISEIYPLRGVDYAEIEISIPKKISGELYKIMVKGKNIKVTRKGQEVNINIGNIAEATPIIQSKNYKKGVYSSKGKLLIKVENNKIKLGR